eukprot:s1209_g20.t1
MINGLMGGMAFLYGGGDFRRTVGVAIAAGFDCDNQAATLAGLIGVMHGGKAIPYDLTHKIGGNNWKEPFNNKYVNERRRPLPRALTNHQIVSKIMLLTERAIVQQGGQDADGRVRLAIETGRELARRLRSSGKEESARNVFLKAASVTMLLDGKQSIEEVLEDWGEAKMRPDPKGMAAFQHLSLQPQTASQWRLDALAPAMAGLSARDYGGGLSTAGWEKRATQDVSLTTDDGFDEEVAQAAGITDEDPNKEFLAQRAKEGRAKAKELAEFAKLQQSQKKDANKGGLASLVAERASAKNTKRELPSFLKVGGVKAQTPEPEAKKAKLEEAAVWVAMSLTLRISSARACLRLVGGCAELRSKAGTVNEPRLRDKTGVGRLRYQESSVRLCEPGAVRGILSHVTRYHLASETEKSSFKHCQSEESPIGHFLNPGQTNPAPAPRCSTMQRTTEEDWPGNMHHADGTGCATLHGTSVAPAVGEDMRKSCRPVPSLG